MEEADITNLWTDLSLGRPIITKPDGTKEVTTVGGAVITYTPPTATTSASISLKNGANEVVIQQVLIVVDGRPYSLSTVRESVEKVKRIIGFGIYDSLLEKEKLIINLPIIMWKLNRPNAAVTLLHWLENTGEALKFDFDWVKNNIRANNAFVQAQNRLRNLNNNSGTIILAENFFQTDGSCDECLNNYNEMKKYIKNNAPLGEEIEIGDFGVDSKTGRKNGFKLNFFRTEKFGSEYGDTDDLGMAWGRASLRQYFKAKVTKINQNSAYVDIIEIGVRFIDSFDFQECLLCLPIPKSDQPLGMWKFDSINPELPNTDPSYLTLPQPDGWHKLTDSDFTNLKNKVYQGKDYNSITPMRFWNTPTTNPITKRVFFTFN